MANRELRIFLVHLLGRHCCWCGALTIASVALDLWFQQFKCFSLWLTVLHAILQTGPHDGRLAMTNLSEHLLQDSLRWSFNCIDLSGAEFWVLFLSLGDHVLRLNEIIVPLGLRMILQKLAINFIIGLWGMLYNILQYFLTAPSPRVNVVLIWGHWLRSGQHLLNCVEIGLFMELCVGYKRVCLFRLRFFPRT